MDVEKASNPAFVAEPTLPTPALTTPLLVNADPVKAKEGLEQPKHGCCRGKKCCEWMRNSGNGCKARCCIGALAAAGLFLAFAVSLGVWSSSSKAVLDDVSRGLGVLGVSWEAMDMHHLRCGVTGEAWKYALTLVAALGLMVVRGKLMCKAAKLATGVPPSRNAKALHIGLTVGFYVLFWLLMVWLVMALVVDYLAAGVVFWTWQLTQTSLANIDTYGAAVQVAGQACPGQCLDLNDYAWMNQQHFGGVCVCDREQVQQAADFLYESRKPFARVAGSAWAVFATALIMLLAVISRSAHFSGRARAHWHAASTAVPGAVVEYGAPAYGALFNQAASKAEAV